jgi:alanine racemase
MDDYHQLAIFEAGISQTGEMARLAEIIQPDIGIFTNLGSAHDEGFSTREEKAREKWGLFKDCKVVIYCHDHAEVSKAGRRQNIKSFTWGVSDKADIQLVDSKLPEDHIQLVYQGEILKFRIPFNDPSSIENILHCITTAIYLEVPIDVIRQSIMKLRKVSMRMELKSGINDCYIVDDSYTNDLAGLESAIDFLLQQPKTRYTLILSDILQSGQPDSQLYAGLNNLLSNKGIDRLIGIGPAMEQARDQFTVAVETFPDTDSFLKDFDVENLKDEAILIKGARIFMFERIVRHLTLKTHGTVLEINLNALSHNLNYFRSRLKPEVKTMVMVKAFAYGSGSYEVASLLQHERVDYLAVAYIDEGIELRNHGITVPTMVLNVPPEGMEKLLYYDLEAEIYTTDQLLELSRMAAKCECKAVVHLKLDTGMHRLGFEVEDLETLGNALLTNSNVEVRSIFTHLAGSDDETHDQFSHEQVQVFLKMRDFISGVLGYQPMIHVLNSAGITRFPEYQFDMVRLGIGLYGYNADPEIRKSLHYISTLKTMISQVRLVKRGETIGYGRMGKVKNDAMIATIAIGYADGFSRAFSNGKGSVLVNGQLAPVIGNICMDMTMIDITGIDAAVGDEVIVFGENPTIEMLAKRIGTIPYEILTGVNDRVKRVFFTE